MSGTLTIPENNSMIRDNYSNVQCVQALAPAVRTADVNSSNIDRQGFGSVTVVASFGTTADTLNTTNKIEARLFDSDDGITFTLVPDTSIIGVTQVVDGAMFARVDSNAKANTLYRLGYRGVKRYLRIFLDFSGTHTAGTPTAAYAIMGHPSSAPLA
jgi:hypothetical protein